MIRLKGSQKQGKKYINQIPTDAAGFGKLFPILMEYINNKAENTPKKTLGPFNTDTTIYQTPSASGLRITWIGHSSLLIEIDGKRLLTDPVWSDRVSFTQSFGPKRFFAPPLPLEALPKLDALILSHDHYDHLDENTIKFLAAGNLPVFCSIGVGPIIQKWGVSKTRITEMDWGDSAIVAGDIKITTAPARHFSGRGMFNRDETLWSSFIIKGPQHNIYFGADSGWHEGFKAIGNAYGPFDLTMLEVGAYGQHWADIHMGPDHASNAHLALKGKIMMPIHWGTFNLAPHAWFEPIQRLLELAKQKNISLFAPKPGIPTEVNGEHISGWWEAYL